MTKDKPLLGVILMLGFCIVAPMGDAVAKLLGASVPLGQLLIVRFCGSSCLVAAFGLFHRQSMADARAGAETDHISHSAPYHWHRHDVYRPAVSSTGRCGGDCLHHAISHAGFGKILSGRRSRAAQADRLHRWFYRNVVCRPTQLCRSWLACLAADGSRGQLCGVHAGDPSDRQRNRPHRAASGQRSRWP